MVLFCGSGSTGAIDTLIRVLDLGRSGRPVVFIGPYEHHSNELPWRESVADVVTIGEDADGRPDLEQLEHELRRHAGRALKIGSFSAASNVTGIITDVEGTARLLHAHGALSFWDYATAGPYLPIDMAGKDAVFLSPHKFVGGPGTPGVLVVKRALLRNAVPSVPGGGTVLFVSPNGHAYHPDPEIREEGGTPAIVESIRAGLVFGLKEEIGVEEIRRREQDFARRALASWARNPNIDILGDTATERLPIVSLGIRHPPRLLHGNFVVALLSDLFGIQARGGCFCAGPYVHRRYGIDDDFSEGMAAQCAAGQLGAKLAFARLGFNYFISEAVFQYILEAVHLLADHGWKLLPAYRSIPPPVRGATATPRPRRRSPTRSSRAARSSPTACSRVTSPRLGGSWRRPTPPRHPRSRATSQSALIPHAAPTPRSARSSSGFGGSPCPVRRDEHPGPRPRHPRRPRRHRGHHPVRP